MFSIRRFAALTIVLSATVATLGGGSPLHAQTPPEIRTVVESYKQAFAKGDLSATFALFDDNVAADDLGTVTSGKPALLAQTMKDLQLFPNISVSFGESAYVLDTAVQILAVAADPIRALGLSRIWIVETLVVFQGKIVSFTDVLDLSDAETLKFAMALAGG